MTPEQHSALEGAQAGDLVLVISMGSNGAASSSRSPPPSASAPVRLLLVGSVRSAGWPPRRRVFIRYNEDLSPQQWITYRRNPPTYWLETRPASTSVPADEVLSASDRVILRPSFDDLLGYFFNGSCPFEPCEEGLVVIDEATTAVLRDFVEPARRYQAGTRTVCPFCMGVAMYRDHEVEVERITNWAGEHLALVIQRREEHMERINTRRRQLGYEKLAEHSELENLRVPAARNETALAVVVRESSGEADETQAGAGAELMRRDTMLLLPWYAVLDGSAERSEVVRRLSGGVVVVASDASDELQIQVYAGPSNSGSSAAEIEGSSATPISSPLQRIGPVVPRLRTRDWYVKAARRVLAEACQICLERFQPGEIVVDLPCWHFFHEECWKKVEGGRCPFRCNEETVTSEQNGEEEEESEDEEQVEVEEIT
ncbi:hypothetical protein CERZMDRAFT_99985 [Cercospora zeae-maydis SCOH1-5]|uniref:RING-type domain-containing protein n=1 Tax=Cercospora zeae-maydis SCOH1-5 TaxID=717836 RepID=A0A6A6F958_9PEZI|nr:hypothetical protein CERZMDRAFT_99985 [Cercospora zeae-maydis SCOH1-5]